MIEISIANLAGVPSVIFGLLGLGLFVRWFNLDRSVLAGGLTLAILVLPVIIAFHAGGASGHTFSIREASYAVRATKWQTVYCQVLPAALGNIMTGVILAIMSRAVGETALNHHRRPYLYRFPAPGSGCPFGRVSVYPYEPSGVI